MPRGIYPQSAIQGHSGGKPESDEAGVESLESLPDEAIKAPLEP
jgi:hypothetical protein